MWRLRPTQVVTLPSAQVTAQVTLPDPHAPSLFLPDGGLQGDAPIPRVSLWTDSCWAAPPLDMAPAGKPQAREGPASQHGVGTVSSWPGRLTAGAEGDFR